MKYCRQSAEMLECFLDSEEEAEVSRIKKKFFPNQGNNRDIKRLNFLFEKPDVMKFSQKHLLIKGLKSLLCTKRKSSPYYRSAKKIYLVIGFLFMNEDQRSLLLRTIQNFEPKNMNMMEDLNDAIAEIGISYRNFRGYIGYLGTKRFYSNFESVKPFFQSKLK